MSWDMDGRKEAMKSYAKKYYMSFWDKKQPRAFPTKYTLDFPDEKSEKAFKKEMTEKRDKIDKELREIRWTVVLWLFGGSDGGPRTKIKKKGYYDKDAKADMVRLQENYWAEEVKSAAENNGGTFTLV